MTHRWPTHLYSFRGFQWQRAPFSSPRPSLPAQLYALLQWSFSGWSRLIPLPSTVKIPGQGTPRPHRRPAKNSGSSFPQT
jgi:hypothetical protein